MMVNLNVIKVMVFEWGQIIGSYILRMKKPTISFSMKSESWLYT